MPSFMEAYEKQFSEVVCIPHFEMNQPFNPVALPGDVGLELEIEGERLPTQGSLERIVGETSKSYWETKTDGSLRGEALEYVLSKPCNISEVATLVNGLYDKFSSSGSRLSLTNRCSTHVHVNMSGKKVNEITSAIALWTAFEEPLTLWAGEERVNNHFCLTAKDSNLGTVSAWRGFLRTGSVRFNDNLKYSALNILTLQRFGSIEYRVMNASEDPERIIDWTKFVFAMTRYAGEQFNNPRSLLYAMSERGGRDLFRDICERAGVSASFVLGVEATVSDLDRAVLDGFRRAQPLVAGFDWDAWMPEITKEYVVNPFGKTKKKKSSILGEDLYWATFDDIARPIPAPRHRIVPLDRGVPEAPPPPAVGEAPRPRPRPDFVPEGFVYRPGLGIWANPHADALTREARARRDMQQEVRSDFNDARFSRIDWSRPVQFTDGTAATVIQIQEDGTMAQVMALRNITDNRGNMLCQPYWYDTNTGVWCGGGLGYGVVQNVPL